MQTIIKDVKDLTPDEYRACYAANYRESGYMQIMLASARRDGKTGTAILLWDDTKVGLSRLVGWALLTPTEVGGMIGTTRYVQRKSRFTAQFWVKRQHRKRGYGKMLMDEVKKIDARPHVLPHDKASSEFLSSYHVTVLNVDRVWMKRKNKVA